MLLFNRMYTFIHQPRDSKPTTYVFDEVAHFYMCKCMASLHDTPRSNASYLALNSLSVA